MKTSCEIIEDLIPLYSDGCASPASAKMIAEHLKECEECREFAASYARSSRIRASHAQKTREVDFDIELPYRSLAKKIRIRRRITTACTVGGVIAAAILLTFAADMYQRDK